MNTQEKTRVRELAAVAKRQPWRAANILHGEVTLLSHLDQRYKGNRLTTEGHAARDYYQACMADPAVEPAAEVPCDYCGKTIEPERSNCCRACATSRE